MYRTISHLKNPFKSLFSRPDHSPISSRLFHSSPLLNYSRQRKDDGDKEDVSLINRDPDSPPKLLVVQPRLRPDTLLQVKLNEALNLANSLEEQRDGYLNTELCDKEMPPHVIVQNPSVRSDKVRADTYFGTGTVDTIKCHLIAAESQSGVDAVFVNTILSGIQQRNLEGVWGIPVLDRVGLIIEIFNAHAYTKEAKLQAELAALMYQKTRLVRARGSDGRSTFGAGGEAEVVSARGRGSGGRGFISGAGETELQLQRRRILERRSRLLSQIEDVRRTRALQRASRKRHGGSNGQALATVAVVGYTNAGKSTLVSALSETDLYSDDRMFATVDPRLRSVALPSGRKVLLSDTVGFISDLPIQLVEAFHATLEEVVEADLLVHVLDSSAPDLEEQRSTVLQVLEQIGVSEEKLNNMIEVWNKIDLQNEEMDADEYLDDYKDDEAGSLSEAEDDDVAPELSQVAEEKDACSLSGEEDGDEAAELLLGDSNESYNDDDNNGDIESELLTDLEETIDDQQGNKSNGWLSTEDGHETEDDQDVPSKGWETLNDQQRDSLKDCSIIRKGSHSQTQHVPHVKTSGVMGVGLQELLVLIDEKLKTKEVKRGSLDRKWRPPRTDDAGIAVEQ